MVEGKHRGGWPLGPPGKGREGGHRTTSEPFLGMFAGVTGTYLPHSTRSHFDVTLGFRSARLGLEKPSMVAWAAVYHGWLSLRRGGAGEGNLPNQYPEPERSAQKLRGAGEGSLH